MTIETSPTTEPLTEVTPDWESPMPPTDLIFDDGEPLETNRHRTAMNILIDSLSQHWSGRNDFFTGGNMFVYYSSDRVKNRDFRGPDFFVVLDVERYTDRQGWVVWEEGGRYPDVIVEITSPSTASVDIGTKKDIYEQVFQTTNYFVFDPFDPNSLQGWHLKNYQYQELQPNDKGWLWCEKLGLWLGTWEGTIRDESAAWLRFYDVQGNLVLDFGEKERQRADQKDQLLQQERQRADQQQQLVQQERQRADQQQQLVQQERERADQQHQRADQQQQLAQQERERADQQHQRAERLAAKLKELGLDSDSV